MRSSTILSSILLPAAALAAVVNVQVGNGALAFNPTSVTANIGDVVVFTYYPKNHTVTQSTFANPCTLAVDPTSGQQGVDSGFMPVAAGTTVGNPTFAVNVTTTSPLWFFCRQTSHCAQGMVFAVNPPTSGAKTFQAYQQLAMQQGSTTAPEAGATVPTVGTTGGTTTGTTGTTAPGGINPATGEPIAGTPGTTGTTGTTGTVPGVANPLTPGATTTTTPSAGERVTVTRALIALVAVAVGLLL